MADFLEGSARALESAGAPVADQGPARLRAGLLNFTVALGSMMIKSSGLLNRRANILHEMGQDNRDPELSPKALDQFVRQHGDNTYQTISRLP